MEADCRRSSLYLAASSSHERSAHSKCSIGWVRHDIVRTVADPICGERRVVRRGTVAPVALAELTVSFGGKGAECMLPDDWNLPARWTAAVRGACDHCGVQSASPAERNEV